eukprot:jgi/Hompol1/4366/HPOL_007072-RA
MALPSAVHRSLVQMPSIGDSILYTDSTQKSSVQKQRPKPAPLVLTSPARVNSPPTVPAVVIPPRFGTWYEHDFDYNDDKDQSEIISDGYGREYSRRTVSTIESIVEGRQTRRAALDHDYDDGLVFEGDSFNRSSDNLAPPSPTPSCWARYHRVVDFINDPRVPSFIFLDTSHADLRLAAQRRNSLPDDFDDIRLVYGPSHNETGPRDFWPDRPSSTSDSASTRH